MLSVSLHFSCPLVPADLSLGIVEDARRALAEGREPILPIPGLPVEITQNPTSPGHRLSLIPGKGTQAESAVVAHLRAMSTQAEPATPPKWMTYAEAEETVKQANDWIDEDGPKGKTKKERPLGSYPASQSYPR